MKKIFVLLLTIALLTPVANSFSVEAKLNNEIRICEAYLNNFQQKIDDLQSKIDAKEKEIEEGVATSRPRGNSQQYIQNLRIEGEKYMDTLKEEIKSLEKLKIVKEANCANTKQELADYLETTRINKVLFSTGENPCDEGFFPKNGKCVAEKELCTDTVNGHYDWESKKCVCNENYRWKLGRCRIIADNAMNQQLLKKSTTKAISSEATRKVIETETTETNKSIQLSYGNHFKRLDKYIVRIRKIESINKALFQFIVLDREMRNKITSYEIKVTSEGNIIANKTASKGISLFKLDNNENIQIEVSMFDAKENLIESANFEVE